MIYQINLEIHVSVSYSDLVLHVQFCLVFLLLGLLYYKIMQDIFHLRVFFMNHRLN